MPTLTPAELTEFLLTRGVLMRARVEGDGSASDGGD